MSDTLETISTSITKKIVYVNKIINGINAMQQLFIKKHSNCTQCKSFEGHYHSDQQKNHASTHGPFVLRDVFVPVSRGKAVAVLSDNQVGLSHTHNAICIFYKFTSIIANIKNTISDYQLGSVDILVHYYKYKHEQNAQNITKYLEMYQTFIMNSGLINQFDTFIQSTKTRLSQLASLIPTYAKLRNTKAQVRNQVVHIAVNPSNTIEQSDSDCLNVQIATLYSEICNAIDSYAETTIKCRNKDINQYTCHDCKIKMSYSQHSSEMVCNRCGLSINVFGVICEDDSTSQDGYKKSKRGSYDPTKHCRFWIERIQARESVEIDADIINRIKEMSKNDCLLGRKLTCMHIREYLHQMKCTQYNEHVPYIRKLITGISPPQLTERELQLINNYFDKVIRIFEEIRPSNKTNVCYHPQLLIKIIDQILSEPENRRRKFEILSNCHLQSRETLIANDRLWKKICDKIPEFVYRPTDRNMFTMEFD